MERRTFIERLSLVGAATVAGTRLSAAASTPVPEPFTISLSQWGFHRAIFGDSRTDYASFIKALHTSPDTVLRGEMDPRDIVVRARELDVAVVDLVNILWFGHGADKPWLHEFKTRAADVGVGFGVLMTDELGKIGAADKTARKIAVDKHLRWMETAAELGCPFLRVNPYGDGTYLEQCRRGAESLHTLAERSTDFGLEILIENHGHPGGNAAWMAMLIEMADHPRLGSYTDFDNFFMGGWGLEPERRYDRLQGMLDLAPYTKAVSAKSHDFGPDGEESTIDYHQCLQAVIDAGFSGLVGAEFEGNRLSEADGSRQTVDLLRREQARFRRQG
jgi:sugar phosphate isomerase/epimerase